jgi:hypothetical protein
VVVRQIELCRVCLSFAVPVVGHHSAQSRNNFDCNKTDRRDNIKHAVSVGRAQISDEIVRPRDLHTNIAVRTVPRATAEPTVPGFLVEKQASPPQMMLRLLPLLMVLLLRSS